MRKSDDGKKAKGRRQAHYRQRSVTGVVETTLLGARLACVGVGVAVSGVVVPLGAVGVAAVVGSDVSAVLAGVTVDIPSNGGSGIQGSKPKREDRSASEQSGKPSHSFRFDTG